MGSHTAKFSPMMRMDFSSEGGGYSASDEMCQRSVYLYVAPALSPEESVYLNLPYCLQTYPFGADITGIGVLQIHAFTNLSSVN